MNNTLLYILIMAATTYVIRALPLTVLRKPIKSRFIRSFLYYVPYVTLAVMTFPSIAESAGSWAAGIAALFIGALLAWFKLGLFPVAIACCLSVLLCNWIF